MARRPRRRKPSVTVHRFGPRDDTTRVRMLELLKSRVDKYPEALEAIRTVLTSSDPLSTMASLAFYALQAGVSDEGRFVNVSVPNVLQHHGELLQAIILTLPDGEWGEGQVSPSDLQAVFDAMELVAETGPFNRVLEELPRNGLQADLATIQHQVRLSTQAVRNWGYISDVMEICTDLYGPLDNAFTERVGFGPSTLIGVARCILAEVEARQARHWETLAVLMDRVIKCETAAEMLVKFSEATGRNVGSDHASPETLDSNAAFQMLWASVDQNLPQVFRFTTEDVAKASGCDGTAVSAAMSTISLSPASLNDRPVDDLLLANPVWTAPLIHLGREVYFAAIPAAIFSHLHQLIDRLSRQSGLTQKLQKRRAAYLEQRVARVFHAAVPDAMVKANARWEFKGKRYETDCLVVVDRTVIAVEAKAGHITPQALRGAPLRLKKHVRELVQNPSVQSARFAAMMHAARTGDEAAAQQLRKLGIPPGEIQQLIRLSVTLEDFSVLCSAERQLKEVGWIPEDLALVPTVPIADLLCVATILEDDPILLTHYLDRRSHFQKQGRMLGDELDFLGWYLANGFGPDAAPGEDDDLFVLTGMSEPIDSYFNGRDHGVDVAKPRAHLAPLFRHILDKLNRTRPPHWLHAGCLLLNCGGLADQEEFAAKLNQLRKRVKRKSRRKNRKSGSPVMTVEIHRSEGDRSALAFCVFPATHRKESREFMQHRASEIVDTLPQSGWCCMFARCIDDWAEPYEAFLLATAPNVPGKPVIERHHLARRKEH